MKPNSLIIGGLLIGLAFAAVFITSWRFANCGRGFFSPDTLEAKTQSEILLILTEIPLYRSAYDFYRYELVDYLVF